MESCALSSRTKTVFAHESLNFHPQGGSSCPSGSPRACTNQKVQWSTEKELCNSTRGAHIDGLINTSIYKLIGSGKIPVIRTLGSLYPSQVWIAVMVIGKWRNAKSCVCPIPITWLAYYRVHSALFLVLLYPHTYFVSLYQFQLMLNFCILTLHVSYLRILVFLPPSHLKENITQKEASGRGNQQPHSQTTTS